MRYTPLAGIVTLYTPGYISSSFRWMYYTPLAGIVTYQVVFMIHSHMMYYTPLTGIIALKVIFHFIFANKKAKPYLIQLK